MSPGKRIAAIVFRSPATCATFFFEGKRRATSFLRREQKQEFGVCSRGREPVEYNLLSDTEV